MSQTVPGFPIMKVGLIPTMESMRQEIEASHLRSAHYGISKIERNPQQRCLTPAGLEEQKRQNRSYLDVAISHIEEFYELLSPDAFMVAVVDREGYILHQAGSDRIKADFAERNCAPGFRWTERDVGTSAISLCLERRIPVQINDKDHYCQRAHKSTSSAAPVFDEGDGVVGVLVVSGDAELVHSHTLLMVVAMARSIERQMRIQRRTRELALNVGFLGNVIESTGTGLMIVDAESRIWRVNRKGIQILKMDDLVGKPLSVIADFGFTIPEFVANPAGWTHRECLLKAGRQAAHFIVNAQPVLSSEGEMLGAVLVLEEVGRIRKLANDMAGTQAFFTFDNLIGSAPEFCKAVELSRRAAGMESIILLQGETGTGKELFAQAIHNGGARRNHPFVPINCGAIPGELLESELFGYVDGAFTGATRGGRPGKFEWASGGTILLDEIGDMPHDMQVKLLRVLQTKEIYRIGARKPVQVDTRIIASTHVDLERAVREGRFRQDLFFRLNVFPIRIPPLRDRGAQDILELARFFLGRGKPGPSTLAPSGERALTAYAWPGNVRELENVIQRAQHLCDGTELQAQDLGLPGGATTPIPWRSGTLEEMERETIRQTLETTGANMAASAKMLGISRATLYRKFKQYQL